jgi:hypothetical protein
MRYLWCKELTRHEKRQNMKFRELFCRVLAHDGGMTMNDMNRMRSLNAKSQHPNIRTVRGIIVAAKQHVL